MIRNEVITGRQIKIKGDLARHEIVQTVVNTFIKTEYREKGKGVSFRYPVEKLTRGTLFIVRPGYKKNFDFKVDIPENISLGKEKQIEIALDLRNKVKENTDTKDALIRLISEVYQGNENDIDKLIGRNEYKNLKNAYNSGIALTDILKILKWLFVMEDIVYWDNEGRAFLYNFIYYAISETDEDRLKEALSKNVVKNPTRLKSYMKKANLKWQPYRL